jgi:hypothetical protein
MQRLRTPASAAAQAWRVGWRSRSLAYSVGSVNYSLLLSMVELGHAPVFAILVDASPPVAIEQALKS